MNEKNLPDDIASKSLNELTDLADQIIKNLENENNLENTSEDYANLLKLTIIFINIFPNKKKLNLPNQCFMDFYLEVKK